MVPRRQRSRRCRKAFESILAIWLDELSRHGHVEDTIVPLVGCAICRQSQVFDRGLP